MQIPASHSIGFVPRCVLASLLMMSGLRAVDGVIPNLTYQPAEQFTAISPQLSSLHLNQPSVYNGYVIFAGNAVHEVWDIANPYAPEKKATFQSNFRSGEAESHQVTYARRPDGTAYMATISGRGVDFWNVTNTIAPTLVGDRSSSRTSTTATSPAASGASAGMAITFMQEPPLMAST
jgi:hypothetical protein